MCNIELINKIGLYPPRFSYISFIFLTAAFKPCYYAAVNHFCLDN